MAHTQPASIKTRSPLILKQDYTISSFSASLVEFGDGAVFFTPPNREHAAGV